MRVLLDDVATVTYMGWAGRKNGELLHATENNGFDVFLTRDQTLAQEQNLAGRRLAVVALFRDTVADHTREPCKDNNRHRRRRIQQFSACRVRHVYPQEAARSVMIRLYDVQRIAQRLSFENGF